MHEGRSIEVKYEAYLFDVQGTLLDFFTPVCRAVQKYLIAAGDDRTSAADLTRMWRRNYFERTSAVSQSAEAWNRVQDEYAAGFHDVCEASSVALPSVSASQEVAASWANLIPWADTAAGLKRMRSRAITATLSNTDMGTMVRLFKRLHIDWDMVLTAEVFGSFKPDPVVYRRAVQYLGLQPSQVAMVACHPYDLRAAAQLGLGTVFVHRPMEYGCVELAHQDEDQEFGQRVSSVGDIR